MEAVRRVVQAVSFWNRQFLLLGHRVEVKSLLSPEAKAASVVILAAKRQSLFCPNKANNSSAKSTSVYDADDRNEVEEKNVMFAMLYLYYCIHSHLRVSF